MYIHNIATLFVVHNVVHTSIMKDIMNNINDHTKDKKSLPPTGKVGTEQLCRKIQLPSVSFWFTQVHRILP